jgi:putative transposase
MALPMRFEWDTHSWSESANSPAGESPSQQHTDSSTVHCDRNVASGESETD